MILTFIIFFYQVIQFASSENCSLDISIFALMFGSESESAEDDW